MAGRKVDAVYPRKYATRDSDEERTHFINVGRAFVQVEVDGVLVDSSRVRIKGDVLLYVMPPANSQTSEIRVMLMEERTEQDAKRAPYRERDTGRGAARPRNDRPAVGAAERDPRLDDDTNIPF